MVAGMTTDERSARLALLETDVERLIRLIDGENGGEINPGIVGVLRRTADQVKVQGGRIEYVERSIDRAKWTFAGFSIAGSALGGGIVFLLTQWFGQVG